MLAKFIVVAAVLAAGSLGVIITQTTPTSAGAVGVLAVFLLTYVFMLSVLTFLVWGVSFAVTRSAGNLAVRKPLERLSFKRSYYFASVLALAPVIIISMQSVGGVGLYEFGLIILLVVVGCVYVAKRTA